MSDLATLRRIVQEVLNDALVDNVYYLELRTTPKAFVGSTKYDYVHTIISVIKVH